MVTVILQESGSQALPNLSDNYVIQDYCTTVNTDRIIVGLVVLFLYFCLFVFESSGIKAEIYQIWSSTPHLTMQKLNFGVCLFPIIHCIFSST